MAERRGRPPACGTVAARERAPWRARGGIGGHAGAARPARERAAEWQATACDRAARGGAIGGCAAACCR
eukprot:5977028-Pyramimonas_sp.AAC.1